LFPEGGTATLLKSVDNLDNLAQIGAWRRMPCKMKWRRDVALIVAGFLVGVILTGHFAIRRTLDFPTSRSTKRMQGQLDWINLGGGARVKRSELLNNRSLRREHATALRKSSNSTSRLSEVTLSSPPIRNASEPANFFDHSLSANVQSVCN